MDEEKRLVSSVDFYFVQEDGNRFKVCQVTMVMYKSSNPPGHNAISTILLYCY